MRVLHVIYIPRFSGVEMLVRDISFVHVAQGHVVAISSFFPPEADFLIEIERMRAGGILWMTPAEPLRKWGRIRVLRKWIHEFNPDVIIAHCDIPSAYARLATIATTNVPVVSVLQHAGENEYGSGLGKCLEKLLTYRAAAIVTVSSRAAANYRKNVREHPRMLTIPNGVRTNEFVHAAALRETHRRTLGIAEDELLVLQVGRLSGIKRQHLSVEAVARVVNEFPKMKFWMAGIFESKECVNGVQGLIESHSLGERVKLLGGRSDVPQLLGACDLFLMPSEHEAHSVALLEALASGAPVIASTIAPFQFAASIPGVTLVDPTDTISYARAIREELRNLRRYDRDLKNFSIDTTARVYSELFQSLTGLH